MDPKEYAARLQRMRDEIETARARESISNDYNKAMDGVAEPLVGPDRLMAQLKAIRATEDAKAKPKAKPAQAPRRATEAAQEPKPAKRLIRRNAIEDEQVPSDDELYRMRTEAEYAHGVDVRGMYGEVLPRYQVPSELASKLGGMVSSAKRRVEQDERQKAYDAKQGVVNPPAVKAAPVPAPAPKSAMSPEERIKGLTPAQAEAVLQDTWSVRGKHGQYSPDETALIEALKARASGFDYSKVKQAPSAYIPSFLGGKK